MSEEIVMGFFVVESMALMIVGSLLLLVVGSFDAEGKSGTV
jgi:hypothetical protein